MSQRKRVESKSPEDLRFLALIFAGLLVILLGLRSFYFYQNSHVDFRPKMPLSTIVTTPKAVATTTTTTRKALNGHEMHLCDLPLNNYTDYSYCYWNTSEPLPLSKVPHKLPSWSEIDNFLKKPIIGSNFTFADLSFNVSTTDPSGMYPLLENTAVTNRPMLNCILASTQFAIDLQKLELLNGQPLDDANFRGSIISGDTLEWLAGRRVNLTDANLTRAILTGSRLSGVIGKPKALPTGWFLTGNGDLVEGQK